MVVSDEVVIQLVTREVMIIQLLRRDNRLKVVDIGCGTREVEEGEGGEGVVVWGSDELTCRRANPLYVLYNSILLRTPLRTLLIQLEASEDRSLCHSCHSFRTVHHD